VVEASATRSSFQSRRSLTRTIFTDADRLKEQLRRNIGKKEYRVENYYKATGFCQALARNIWFEYLTLGMVALNSVWIGIELDTNPSDALPQAPAFFQAFENIFCFYFTLEVSVRFAAFEKAKRAFKDFHMVCDAVLVILMISETWLTYLIVAFGGGTGTMLSGTGVSSLLRILRLSRVFRLVRLLRAMPELTVLIKGLGSAARSVGWTMVLLAMIIYLFAVGFTVVTNGTNLGKSHFNSVIDSIVTLLLPGLLPDFATLVLTTGREHVLYATCLMVFIMLASLTVMNMLIGVICESVSTVATVERERMNIAQVKAGLENLMHTFDKDSKSTLSKYELEGLLVNPSFCKIINEAGVDIPGLVDVAEFHFFAKGDEVSFTNFLSLVLQLRGTNTLTVRDAVNLRKFLVEEIRSAEARLTEALSTPQ